MVIPDGLRLIPEWEDPDGVRAPELAATWARLEVWVGPECVSQLEDVTSHSTRRSLYCSLYPLAEWMAFNWWHLMADFRPAAFLPSRWSFGSIALNGSGLYAWLRHHNLREAGEGFRWPNLTIVPEGGYARLVWRRDPVAPTRAHIRYLAGGEALVESSLLQRTLSEFIELVLTRLDENGVTESPLEAEWKHIQAADDDEREFCVAAARLGLDPYTVEPSISAQIERAAERLDDLMLEELLGAVRPQLIDQGLEWIETNSGRIEDWPGQPAAELEFLRARSSALTGSGSPLPWDAGYEQARQVRAVLGMAPSRPFEVGPYLLVAESGSADRALEAIGGDSAAGVSAMVLGRSLPEEAVRFSATRALWHLVFESHRSRFLLTSSHAQRQKVERAFAAELLAPAAGVRELLGDSSGGILSEGDIEEAAAHFRVSSLVIGHQVENQLADTAVD